MFKILSIDGGGIRGIIPANILACIEKRLEGENRVGGIHDYFDMICGTSTGGILALGLAMGISANTILNLYKQKARDIFPERRSYHYLYNTIFNKSLYTNTALKKALKEAFVGEQNNELKIGDCKTRVCIPVYDANNGTVKVFKTPHHEEMTTHYKILASDVAMMTAAAPVYFLPYSCASENKVDYNYNNMVDGGLVANNPSMIGLTEAVYGLGYDIGDIAILSIGTGNVKFGEVKDSQKLGMKYFLNPLNKQKKLRIYEMMASAQNEYINNTIKIMSDGIGHDHNQRFIYKRIQHEFAENNAISMDASDDASINSLSSTGYKLFQDCVNEIYPIFFAECKQAYTPCYQ